MMNTTDKSTSRLPNGLVIALWLVGAIWPIGLIAYAFDVGPGVVYATLVFGFVAGGIEWMTLRRS